MMETNESTNIDDISAIRSTLARAAGEEVKDGEFKNAQRNNQ